MSENRSRYSSAPLQDLRRKPRPAAPAAPGRPAAPGAGPGSHVLLQVLLVAVLPIAFFVALVFKNTTLYWGFVAASLLSVLAMYLLRAFVPNARRVLGVIHTAMIVVMLFTILVSVPPPSDTRTQTSEELQSLFNDDTTASMRDMNTSQTATSQDTQTTSEGTASLAQQNLEQFMAAWNRKDYTSMVALSSPNWVNGFETQREAETGMFHLSAIRTPVSYKVVEVLGNDTDQTRTINMQASISRSDGREPQLYNFQVLMIRANNQWYVDPNSISSSQLAPQTSMGQQAMAEESSQVQDTLVLDNTSTVAVPQVGSVRSDTLLYYNQDGGEYYHIDPNCSSVGSKYKPLKATFYYRDVSSDTFKNLKPCPHCKAPARP